MKEDIAIIMEDDITFTLVPYWKKSMKDILNDIPGDCDIFLLSNHKSSKVKNIKIERCQDHSDFNGVCYIMTKKGIEKAKKLFNVDDKVFDFSKLDDYVFDRGFMKQFNVYTYNITLFLLENFDHDSTYADNDFNDRITTHTTKKVLDINSFLPIN